MLSAGLASELPPPKTPRSIDHPHEGMSRTEILNSAFLQTPTQAQLRRTGSSARPPLGWVDFQDRHLQGQVGAEVARSVRRENTPVTGEAEEHGWLNSAVQDLADCPDAAAEEGLDKPSELGLSKSEAVLMGISGLVKEQPDIYPMEGSGIVIDLRSPGRSTSVLMVVERDGAGVLFYRASGKKGRVRVDDAAELPNLLKKLGLSTAEAMENR